MARTIAMTRDGLGADVHPDEEGEYARFGWVRSSEASAPVVEEPVVETAPPEPDEGAGVLVSVYRVVDGERKTRASRADISRAEAEAYVAERPESEYAIVADDE